MKKIRVFIVDDTAVVRRMITGIIENDPEMEVVGQASNGKEALDLIQTVNADIITMDIEMPVMDGISTVKEIRKFDRKTPILMLSSLTLTGAEQTFDALIAGATDYITKPSNSSDLAHSLEKLTLQLLPRIKSIYHKSHRLEIPQTLVAPKTGISKSKLPKPEILCIGTSTGGPNALDQFFQNLNRSIPIPILIVQHMPPVFTKKFAERMDTKFVNTFHEAMDGQLIEKGHVYIAPGGKHMEAVADGDSRYIKLHEGDLENSCRPSVDPLFRSVARIYKSKALSIILTGMGQDGLKGCKEILKLGGKNIVQDKATSIVWGMPRAVSEANLADKTLPLNRIHEEVIHRLGLEPAYT